MNYKEIVLHLENRERFGIQLGLERIHKVLNILNHPEKNLPTIHITGTNGKGSTAAYIAKILEFAGYKVGLYTSPHLIDIRERIQINGHSIPVKSFFRIAMGLLDIEKSLGDKLTYFEFLTALAFKYFSEEKIDFLVLEVGLGGRLDATNVIEKPLVSVITNIGYEHIQYLGKSLQSIALEKAGIIKKNGFVTTAIRQKRVMKLIESICQQRKAKLFCLEKDFGYSVVSLGYTGYQEFDYRGIFSDHKNLKIKLFGKYQIDNATLAIGTVEVLRFQSIFISKNAIREGLGASFLPGRFEILRLTPRPSQLVTVVLDGAHNPLAIHCLKNNFLTYLQEKPRIILGILVDKDIGQIVREIVPLAKEIILSKPQYYRAANPEILYKEVKKCLPENRMFVTSSVSEAIRLAFKRTKGNTPLLITGSFYMVGEAKKILNMER